MTGNEAAGILSLLDCVREYLLDDDDKNAFYYLGVLSESLSRISEIDKCSFKPKVEKEETDPEEDE